VGLITGKKPSLEDLEDQKEYLDVKSEVASREAEVAEKEAIVKELKRKYGSGWKNILGLRGRIDLQTLRSVLGGMSKGLKGQGGALYNPNLSPLPGKNLRR